MDKPTNESGRKNSDKFKQLEVDALIDTWRKLKADLLQMDIEVECPKRTILIQPAVTVQE
jgi:hypothetical protein